MIFLKTRYIFTEIKKKKKKIRNSLLCRFFLHMKFFIFAIAHAVPSVEFYFPNRLGECFQTKASLVLESPACHRLLLVLSAHSQGAP